MNTCPKKVQKCSPNYRRFTRTIKLPKKNSIEYFWLKFYSAYWEVQPRHMYHNEVLNYSGLRCGHKDTFLDKTFMLQEFLSYLDRLGITKFGTYCIKSTVQFSRDQEENSNKQCRIIGFLHDKNLKQRNIRWRCCSAWRTQLTYRGSRASSISNIHPFVRRCRLSVLPTHATTVWDG